jgi:hypothetical protein
VVEPGLLGRPALDALAPLPAMPGVESHSGPFPLLFKALTARDLTVRVVIEGRDHAPAAVDQPAVTDGTWVRPGGVVVERAFADALGVRLGDTVGVDGHRLRVAGTAVSTARTAYPNPGWHYPGTVLMEGGGLVWVDRGDIATLAGDQPLSCALNLKLTGHRAVHVLRRRRPVRTRVLDARHGPRGSVRRRRDPRDPRPDRRTPPGRGNPPVRTSLSPRASVPELGGIDGPVARA